MRKKLWTVILAYWTLFLIVWTVLCWNAWKAKAAARPKAAAAPKQEEKIMLDVPFLSQRENWPTGCESVSAVMALQYAGMDISVDEFIDGYLPLGEAPHLDENGRYVGCDPRLAFPGDPRSEDGWGCYVPVIEDAVNRLLRDRPEKSIAVENLSGKSLTDLCGYVKEGRPVLVWATIGMAEPFVSDEFFIEGTEERFSWVCPMHCLVLTGYDGENYFFNDPMEQKNTAYPKEAVEKAYKGLGEQAAALFSAS